MKLIATLRSPLLIVSVLSLSRHANAFTTATTTRPVHLSTFARNQQQAIKSTTTPPVISRTTVYAGRNLNDDTDRTNKCDSHTLTQAAIQLSKTIMMVSFISTSMFVADIDSVSAVSVNQMNDVSSKSPSFLLAKGAYVPEEGYATLDFSMPSYRVESDVQPINSVDLLGGGSTSSNDDRTSATAKKASSPSRAEKGALAVAQAKAKKEALKAEALAKQQELKGQAFVKSEATSD